MDYRREVALTIERYGFSRFSIEDINHQRQLRGEEPFTTQQMLTFVSILKKRYPIKTSYVAGIVYTKTYFQLLKVKETEKTFV